MKLYRITTLIQFIFTGLLLIIAGNLIFRLITDISTTEVKEKLYVNKERIVEQLRKRKIVTELKPIIEIRELTSNQKPTMRISEKWVYDPMEGEKEKFMEVFSVERINGKTYAITTRQVILEDHDFSNSIFNVLIIVFSILLIGLLLFNYLLARITWRTFYQNLESLKQFSLEKNQPIVLRNSRIREFKELYKVITGLTERLQKDYLSAKEFSEYASHEIQTPLAIIHAKQEELLQDEHLTERNAALIKNTLTAAGRLSKLNKALLLITKIENHQFVEEVDVNLWQTINQTLDQLSDMILIRKLNVLIMNDRELVVHANKALMETLILNLINNAIKHNVDNGSISIDYSHSKLIISNTGRPSTVPPEKLFDRFSKANPSSGSLGLGLPIVKRICELYDWSVSYSINDDKHVFTIEF